MKENVHKKCGECKFWHRDAEDMLPLEDKPKIPGMCNNEHIPSYGQLKMPHQGTKCKGWSL